MALVRNVTKRVDIPHEPGEFMEFRKLSWRQLDDARNARSAAVLGRVREMGAEVFRELGQLQQPAPSPEAADMLGTLDRRTLLVSGIQGWSYSDPPNAESIDLLDEQTAEWAAQEILALTRPRSEEDRKNA